MDIDPNSSDEKKTTHFHQATLHRDVRMEYLLLSGKGNPKLKNLDGIAPLHRAAMNFRRSSIISMLLKYGADINMQDVNGNIPLHLAVYFKCEWTVERLLEFGVRLDIVNLKLKTPNDYANPGSLIYKMLPRVANNQVELKTRWWGKVSNYTIACILIIIGVVGIAGLVAMLQCCNVVTFAPLIHFFKFLCMIAFFQIIFIIKIHFRKIKTTCIKFKKNITIKPCNDTIFSSFLIGGVAIYFILLLYSYT